MLSNSAKLTLYATWQYNVNKLKQCLITGQCLHYVPLCNVTGLCLCSMINYNIVCMIEWELNDFNWNQPGWCNEIISTLLIGVECWFQLGVECELNVSPLYLAGLIAINCKQYQLLSSSFVPRAVVYSYCMGIIDMMLMIVFLYFIRLISMTSFGWLRRGTRKN